MQPFMSYHAALSALVPYHVQNRRHELRDKLRGRVVQSSYRWMEHFRSAE